MLVLEETHQYDDIISLPHPVSGRRAGMSMLDRAAQFAPFAALTGYDGVIEETGRLTDFCTELTEGRKAELNEMLLAIREVLDQKPQVRITYFQPDDRKAGGAYVCTAGSVKKLNEYEGLLIFTDGRQIPIDQIHAIDWANR